MHSILLTIPRTFSFLFILLLITVATITRATNDVVLVQETHSAVPLTSSILLVSTLDGLLHAVDQQKGDILWTVKEPPRLQVSSAQIGDKFFVSDPRDGSIYWIDTAKNVRKFPKTIPEMVSESPQKTSDGIMITGKKTATWMAIDPINGSKYDYQPEALSTCPIPSDSTVFIPRTEYVLSLLDSSRQHVWNVTYTHYGSASKRPAEVSTDLILSSSNSGELLKMSPDRLSVSWYQKYSSPVAGVYSLTPDGSVREISHHVVIPQMMKRFLSDTESARVFKHVLPELSKSNQLVSTQPALDRMLFVGQHGVNVYCLPTLLDRKTPKGEKMPPFYESVIEAIGGPSDEHLLPLPTEADWDKMEEDGFLNETGETGTTALTVKPEPKCIFTIIDEKTIVRPSCSADINDTLVTAIRPDYAGYHPFPVASEFQDTAVLPGLPLLPPVASPILPSLHVELAQFGLELNLDWNWIWVMVSTVVLTVISMLVGMLLWRRWNGTGAYASSTGSAGSSNGSLIRSNTTHVSDTMFVVGKIEFNPTQLLGRGCDGTCVFRGVFDGRDVAVKRLLPDCFSFADREVALLRESDFHSNVIRYYATESDSQFRYIALELCQGTLTDYVDKTSPTYSLLPPKNLLKQAMDGISHLHKLNIVHRDIKPHNILLTAPTLQGHVRVLISDFGLCKKISLERTSFSKVNSGVLGTQGWIAPEMLDGEAERAGRSVDIFSAGCVFYYCITGGKHPFGDNGFARQGNIVEGKWSLDHLNEEEMDGLMSRHVIAQMIQAQPERRPSAECVLVHPYFWDHARHLSFLQDISDRIERDDITSPVILSLEKNAGAVVRWNWRQHIGEELQDDLKKFRSYRGNSVRDLLRAIRNKKHHYRELPDPVRDSLGSIPEGFVDYFATRFPRLILHTYLAIQICKEEKQLSGYFSLKHEWPALENPIDRPWRRIQGTDGETAAETMVF